MSICATDNHDPLRATDTHELPTAGRLQTEFNAIMIAGAGQNLSCGGWQKIQGFYRVALRH